MTWRFPEAEARPTVGKSLGRYYRTGKGEDGDSSMAGVN